MNLIAIMYDCLASPTMLTNDLKPHRNDYTGSGKMGKWPAWQAAIMSPAGVSSDRDQMAPTMDSMEEENPSFGVPVSGSISGMTCMNLTPEE